MKEIKSRGQKIAPITLTRFWHRRLCEAAMLVAAIVLALYLWAFFADVISISPSLLVGTSAAVVAGITLLVSFLLYVWQPKGQIFVASLAVFGLLVVLTALLIIETGLTASPFIALWMIVSVFAGVFGTFGIVPLFIAVVALVVQSFLAGTLDVEQVTTVVLGGLVPLAVGYLLWHSQKTPGDKDQDAYKELASELSQVAGKAEVVINAIGDGVLALNSHGIIELINPAAQRLIGWGKQDALGLDYKSVLKLLDKKGSELTEAIDPVARVLADNKPINSKDFSLVTNSGKTLLISLIISPVGQPGSGVIVVFRDITKELSEERQQAEFISTASHEMRTPVASIEGYLGLALNPATAQIDAKARDFIGKAHESAQHLGRLFQDLLDVTKADDGRMSNNPKVTDVVVFTHEVVQSLMPKAIEKGLRVTYKPEPDDAVDNGGRVVSPIFYVNVDNDHLNEVLSNLIENAIKYTPKGDVIVDVTGQDDKVVISIQDSGIGIPREDQAHLFQKFYRVDNSDTREIGGTGLGLYLCRRLVEAMNGRIWVESEYKKGSTFFVALPRLASNEATRMIEQATEAAAAAAEHPTITAEKPTGPAISLEEDVTAGTSSEPPQSLPPIATQQPAQAPPALPAQPPAASRPNTPITTIEQNAGQYIGQHRDLGLNVPPRNRFK